MADHEKTRLINISQCEGRFSIFGGTVLILKALRKGSLFLAGLGSALLYRGVSRHCHVFEFLDINTAEESESIGVAAGAGGQATVDANRGKKNDKITEAGEESFPASDPPAWTTGTT